MPSPSPRTAKRWLDTGRARPIPSTHPIRAVLTTVCNVAGCMRLHLEVCRMLRSGDGEPVMSNEPGAELWFDTATSAIGSVDPSDEPEAAWLRAQLEDWFHTRWARHHEQRDLEVWRRHDWSGFSFGNLASYRDAFPSEWDTLLAHGGHHYVVDDLYCINPRCDCQNVYLAFGRVHESEVAPVGYVTVSIVTLEATRSTTPLASTLWAELTETEALVDELAARRRRMRGIGQKLQREGLVPAPVPPRGEPEPPPPSRAPDLARIPRATTKVGRNAPCPCGSGRKYKRCCLGKAEQGRSG